MAGWGCHPLIPVCSKTCCSSTQVMTQLSVNKPSCSTTKQSNHRRQIVPNCRKRQAWTPSVWRTDSTCSGVPSGRKLPAKLHPLHPNLPTSKMSIVQSLLFMAEAMPSSPNNPWNSISRSNTYLIIYSGQNSWNSQQNLHRTGWWAWSPGW